MITYKELSADPKQGIYKVVGTNTFVISDGIKLVHSPRGMTIDADTELEEI